MIATLQCTVIDCPDPAALAAFYERVLGWRLNAADPTWVTLTSPQGQQFAFQQVANYQPPRWPDPAHPQQFHLDFEVGTRQDVEQAQREVEALGATFLHDSGGARAGFRVFTDPAGHPFCLCYGQG
ncbi:VOC family protein [Streptomyces zagrosensis]|uniref:Catechol 2,3-dioxygenase-like lactoylglutathione lyase family enzyme n=1 Tax=Streptomyces zagrosensis TaxID=1042984 RepID=A0A7W9UW60_9ACTN|nr:VOC family protein [Streptomyces zagrosensis]MBB5933555.1 catechol 2,3-dioxygenase-like lactoylglutathione lyase family enzyme [Streptomyces zagrosensis]